MKYKLADSTLIRIVQIVQEGMLTGTDVADAMRMIELQTVEDSDRLILSDEYKKVVEEQHKRMLEFAEQMQAQIEEEE